MHCALHYKFFGTHEGILYGRYDLQQELFAYKVRPAPDTLPDRFETGTQNHEGLAGELGAVEYFDWLGQTFGQAYEEKYAERFSGGVTEMSDSIRAGVPAITLMGLTRQNVLPYWHQPGDTVDKIDPEALRVNYAFAWHFIQAFDQQER